MRALQIWLLPAALALAACDQEEGGQPCEAVCAVGMLDLYECPSGELRLTDNVGNVVTLGHNTPVARTLRDQLLGLMLDCDRFDDGLVW